MPVNIESNCSNGDAQLSACAIPADAALVADGWVRRFIADLRMARDAQNTYQELGYEVRLEPMNAAHLKEECNGCRVLFKQFCAVYTRKKLIK